MTLKMLVSDHVVHRLGWCLIHFVWQGLAVAIAVALILGLLRRQSANARYLVCFAALLVMAALPVLTYAVQEVPGIQALAGGVSPLMAGAGTAASTPGVVRGLVSAAHDSLKDHSGDVIESFLPWFCMAWMLGVLALALQNVAAWYYVRGMIRRETSGLDTACDTMAERLRLSLGIRRPVRLLQSVRAASPMAAGILKPVVLLPAAVITGLTPQQVEAVLAHELAHVRRHDFLANLVQTAIEIFLFYHPAVWWVSRRVREERENCCDDIAVQVCGSTIQYARALASLAEFATTPTVLAVGATGGLFRRVQRIVGLPEQRSIGSAPLFAGLSVILVLLGSALGGQFAAADVDLTAGVDTLDIDTATTADLRGVFGEPKDYVWGDKHFDVDNLPAMYIINFPNKVDVWMDNNAVNELRFYRANYTFRGGIRVGSTVNEVVSILGPPTQTVEGRQNEFVNGILYTNIDGHDGRGYYAREDCGVRMFFSKPAFLGMWAYGESRVVALYVTRSDFTAGRRTHQRPEGAAMVDLTEAVAKVNIDTATLDDLVRVFGNPTDYVWGQQKLDVDNLPETYCVLFPNDLCVWIRNGVVQELRFEYPNYTFQGKVRLGSTVEEVVAALGPPTQTIEGQPNAFLTGVLYKDIGGRKGYCYYGREDLNVRMFFGDYRVSAIYVTRTGFSASH